MKRMLPAIIAFSLTIAVLEPLIASPWVHGDELWYAWSADYYGRKLASLDLSPVPMNMETDPGWSPYSGWAQDQPMSPRFIYAVALALTGAPAPEYALDASQAAFETMWAIRVAAVLLAALGMAMIAHRLRWPALVAAALFLALPQVREDLARGWGEGPLLFGIGLCVLSYGSRWFAVACGLAATFKLTALGIWPLMYLPGAVGSWRRLRVLGPLLTAMITWSALNPPSWFAGGPPFLVTMILYRSNAYGKQNSLVGEGPLGLFLPSRYVWPIELAALLAIAVLAPCLWTHFEGTRKRPVREGAEGANLD